MVSQLRTVEAMYTRLAITSSARQRLTKNDGIAIGPILFVIAIIAVLATAIAAGTGSFSSDTQREADSTQADVLLGWINTVQIAVGRAVALGTPWTSLSFGSPALVRIGGVTGSPYVDNPNCTTPTCKIFGANGGAVVYRVFTEAGIDDATALANGFNATSNKMGWTATYLVNAAGIGSNGAVPSLVMLVYGLRLGVCDVINARIGNPYVAANGTRVPFADTSQGTCSNCDTSTQCMTNATLKNKLVFTRTGAAWCELYAVLYVR